MKKNIVIFDILFYLVTPYFIWNYGREPLGDYYAMLLSTSPGILYTLYRFFVLKQFNITGLFILAALLLGTTVDLLSGSAEEMLWNQVYFGIVLGVFFLCAIAIKKPLAMYFAIDVAFLQGVKRENSYALFTRKEIFIYYQIITGVFALRVFFDSGLKVTLLFTMVSISLT